MNDIDEIIAVLTSSATLLCNVTEFDCFDTPSNSTDENDFGNSWSFFKNFRWRPIAGLIVLFGLVFACLCALPTLLRTANSRRQRNVSFRVVYSAPTVEAQTVHLFVLVCSQNYSCSKRPKERKSHQRARSDLFNHPLPLFSYLCF